MLKYGKMVNKVLNSIFIKANTVRYPFERRADIKDFRGKIKFIPEKCIGCKLCERDCPSNAIKINKVGEKRFELELELDRCIFCGQCVDSCLKDAIELTGEFELAQLNRSKLKVVYHAKPAEEKLESKV